MSKHCGCGCNEYEYCYQTALPSNMGMGVAPYGGCAGGSGISNLWSLIVLLIILCKPKVLCNDRAFLLILLLLFCGGSGANGFGSGMGCC